MFLSYILILSSVVNAFTWFSSDPEYAKWSHAELRTWLEDQHIKVPSSFDKPHLYGLVDANWHAQPPPLSAYSEAGRQWSFDQYSRARRAFEHVTDDSFDKWDESRLRAFLLEQGVVAPSGPREQLVLLARNKYRAYTDAAAFYSSIASASASSAYAGASDAAHSACQCISDAVAQATHEVTHAIDKTQDYVYSTWDDNRLRKWLEDQGIVEAKRARTKEDLLSLADDCYRKANSVVWESWSDSYIREWLIAHNLLEPTDTLSRSSLLGKMKKYYYNSADRVWDTWTDSELKAWLVDRGFLKSDTRNRDEMVAMVGKYYLSGLDSIWGTWTDSDIQQWLSEHGYLESVNDPKSHKDLVDMMESKYPDASAKVPSYLVWPDARLRTYLRERGISESALPTNREGLLHEARIRCVQTSTKAESIFTRFMEIIGGSVEAVEEKVAQALEVLSDSRGKACAGSWGSHTVDQTRKNAEEIRQCAQQGMGGESRAGDEL